MLKLITKSFVVVSIFALSLSGLMPIKAQEEFKALPEPTNFYIDLIEENNVILLWDEVRDPNLEGYIILKSEQVYQAPQEIARLSAAESSYTDDEITAGKTYTYQVKTYGGNFLTGDSEVKSVVIQKDQAFSSPFAKNEDDTTSTGSTVSAATDFIKSEEDNFWELFIAVNTLAFGLLLLSYMIIRYFLIDRKKKKYDKFLNMKLMRKARMKLRMKSDHEHPDIVEDAKDKYYGKKKGKLKEWLETSRNEDSVYTLPQKDTTQS